jgi:hypothetical protein
MPPRDPFARRFDDRGRPYQPTYGQVPPNGPPPMPGNPGSFPLPPLQPPMSQPMPYQQAPPQYYQTQAPLQPWPTNIPSPTNTQSYANGPSPIERTNGRGTPRIVTVGLIVLLVFGALIYGGYVLSGAGRKANKSPDTTVGTTPTPNPTPNPTQTTPTTPSTQPKDTSPEAKARDAERLTDINALALQFEDYYSEAGQYPTLANINDGGWLVENMQQIPSEALRDPKGTDYILADKPTVNIYSYQPADKDGQACNNTSVKCSKYALTALLEDGGSFAKKNSK